MPTSTRPVVVLLALAFGTLLFGPKSIQSDGTGRRDNLARLLDHGDPRAKRYSHVGPLASAPLLLLDRALGTGETLLVQYNLLLFAAGVLALTILLRPVTTADVRARFAVVLVFASMFPANTLTYFGETFTAVSVAVGFAAVVVRGSAWGWPLVVLGVVNTPAATVGLLFAVAVYCWHEGRWRPLVVVPIAVALILGENGLARGSPFATGYEGDAGEPTVLPFSARPGFSYPLAFGLLSLLLSFGKGLVFFAPGLFLAPPPGDRRLRLLTHVWLAFTAGLVLVYAKWWAWYGGLAWGPRMLLFASLPASLTLARRSADGRRGVAVAAVLLSAWVGVSGFAFSETDVRPFVGDRFETEFALWYVPECSVLWLPFVVPVPVHPAGVVFLILGGLAIAYLIGPTLRRFALTNRPDSG